MMNRQGSEPSGSQAQARHGIRNAWSRLSEFGALVAALIVATGIFLLQSADAVAAQSTRKSNARQAKPQTPKARPRTQAQARSERKSKITAGAGRRITTANVPTARIETGGIPLAARKDGASSAAAIAASLIGAGLPEPLVMAAPLRETGAHLPPVAPPAQLAAAPHRNPLLGSPALRLRSAYAQLGHSPFDTPENVAATPVRLAMLPRITLPLSLPAPAASEPQIALPTHAPGPWSEPHMEPDDRPLGRWAKPALPWGFDKVHFAPHAPQRCLPAKLKKAIYDIAEHVGEVRVISTHRDHARNRRVRGTTRSMHLECRAIDFVVPGRHRNLVAYLRSRSDIGGYKRYPSGSYHIDDGVRRTW